MEGWQEQAGTWRLLVLGEKNGKKPHLRTPSYPFIQPWAALWNFLFKPSASGSSFYTFPRSCDVRHKPLAQRRVPLACEVDACFLFCQLFMRTTLSQLMSVWWWHPGFWDEHMSRHGCNDWSRNGPGTWAGPLKSSLGTLGETKEESTQLERVSQGDGNTGLSTNLQQRSGPQSTSPQLPHSWVE